MNSLKALLKVEFYSFFKFNLLSQRNKNKKQRIEKITNLCVYVFFSIVACVGTTVITSLAVKYDLSNLIFPIITIMVFAIIFMFMLLKQFVLYGRNDYDMIISLPVNLSKIVFAKLSVFFTQSLLISSLFFLPSGITYGLLVKSSILYYIKLVIVTVVTPLLPFVLSVLLGVLFGYIATSIKSVVSKRLKIFWNVASGLILALIVVAYAYFSLNFTKYVTVDLIDSIATDLTDGNVIAKLVNDILYKGNNLAFLFYVVLCCLAFVISMIIISYFFPVINQRMMLKASKSNYKMTTITSRSQLKAILDLEIKRYFSTSIYVFNTLGFAIFSIILTCAILFVSPESILKLLEIKDVSTEIINEYLLNLLPVFTVVTLLLNNTTNASISIEGTTFWHTSFLPFNTATVYKAKLLVNLILFVPIGIISAIAFSIKFNLNLVGYITLFITPISGILFCALLGLWLNLQFANFEYQNPVEVIKAGTPVLGSILGGLILIIILFTVAVIFSNVGLLLVDGLLFICSYLIWNKVKSIQFNNILVE